MSQSVDRWLGRLSPNTKNKQFFDLFIEWLRENGGEFKDYTPDELVEYQKNATNDERYDLLDLVEAWVGDQEGRYNAKAKRLSAVRSFFLHNRAELPRDPSFNIQADTPRVTGSLTIEEIRDVVLSSNPVYQAIFLSMFQAGMGQEEFIYWNLNGWRDLKRQLEDEAYPVKVELPGRKRARFKKPYYAFLGRDAVEAIKNWIPHRPRDTAAIFTDQFKAPITKDGLTTYWKRHLKKLGFIKPREKGGPHTRYGKNVHEIRDVFRSQWEKSPAKVSVAEFMMGHQVDPLEYNKAFRDEEWVRKEYRKAESMLNIMSSARPFGQVSEDEYEEMQNEIQRLRNRVTELEDYGRTLGMLAELVDTPEKRERLKKLLQER